MKEVLVKNNTLCLIDKHSRLKILESIFSCDLTISKQRLKLHIYTNGSKLSPTRAKLFEVRHGDGTNAINFHREISAVRLAAEELPNDHPATATKLFHWLPSCNSKQFSNRLLQPVPLPRSNRSSTEKQLISQSFVDSNLYRHCRQYKSRRTWKRGSNAPKKNEHQSHLCQTSHECSCQTLQ